MTLLQLRVRDLAVVRDATFEPGTGFTALTGETGSGKSVCVTALRLALGGRVEGDPVRPGARAGRATAVFGGVSPALRERLAGVGVPYDDVLTLTREVVPGGRGSCRINGTIVSMSVLRDTAAELVEITAQGESTRLVLEAAQRGAIDAMGGAELASAAEHTSRAVEAWRTAGQRLRQIEEELRVAYGRRAEAETMVEALAPLQLAAGEAEGLAAERERLRHLRGLQLLVGALGAAAAGGDDSAADLVASALTTWGGVRGLDERVDAVATRAEALVAELRELARDAGRVEGSLDLDDARLADLDERLDTLERIRRRFGSIEDALEQLAAAEALIAGCETGAAQLQRCAAEVEASKRSAGEAAVRLSGLRHRAAGMLERSVNDRLRSLHLAEARFKVVLGRSQDADGVTVDGVPYACTRHGIDDIEFRLATSRRSLPVPLGTGQSGGELSRLALALRAVAATADDVPTVLLDEVDTGIGGDTAAAVGALLAELGSRRQVIAITHRAEIAAQADAHSLVERRREGDEAVSEVRPVTGTDRVDEVARLLSGRPTAAARARAQELLAGRHSVAVVARGG